MAVVEKRSREEWQDLDRDHYLHPFTDYKDLGQKKSRIITRADGVYIYDADDNEILDGIAEAGLLFLLGFLPSPATSRARERAWTRVRAPCRLFLPTDFRPVKIHSPT
jgi:4-aminobutyrate aminotransferase-like enzyme